MCLVFPGIPEARLPSLPPNSEPKQPPPPTPSALTNRGSTFNADSNTNLLPSSASSSLQETRIALRRSHQSAKVKIPGSASAGCSFIPYFQDIHCSMRT